MELYRKELKLAVIKGLDESRGSSNVPIKLTHDTSDEYINYTEQIHVRYLLDNQVKEEILPTNGSGFYIPGKPLSHDGPIELAVHLINGDIELVTNELSFVVKNAPNGTTQVDPSEFTWQQLVDQYVNAKLDTFANKLDLSKFEEKVNGSIENQSQNIESFITEVNANLSNKDKKITDLQTSTQSKLDSQDTKINDFKAEVNTSLSNQTTSINQTTSVQNSKITTLEGRMDTFTRLSEGSTTGDAELQDIRVGANGVTYNNAGDAVRGQYSQLKEDLDELEYKTIKIYKSFGELPIHNKVDLSRQYSDWAVKSELPAGQYKIKYVKDTNDGFELWYSDNSGQRQEIGTYGNGVLSGEITFTLKNSVKGIALTNTNPYLTNPMIVMTDTYLSSDASLLSLNDSILVDSFILNNSGKTTNFDVYNNEYISIIVEGSNIDYDIYEVVNGENNLVGKHFNDDYSFNVLNKNANIRIFSNESSDCKFSIYVNETYKGNILRTSSNIDNINKITRLSNSVSCDSNVLDLDAFEEKIGFPLSDGSLDNTGTHIEIPSDGIFSIDVALIQSELSAYITFVKDNRNYQLCHGTSRYEVNGTYESRILRIPKDCKYIIIGKTHHSINFLPRRIFVRKISSVFDASNIALHNSISSINAINSSEKYVNARPMLIKPEDFSGNNLSEKVINANAFILKSNGNCVLYFGDNKEYIINEAIILPSNTKVVINDCCVRLKDLTHDNIFRTANLIPNESDRNAICTCTEKLHDISIIGYGNAEISGPINRYKAPAPNTDGPIVEWEGDLFGWRGIGIIFEAVDNFEISGFKFSDGITWSIYLHGSSNGSVHDIIFNTRRQNGDGVDITNGCHHINVYNIGGFSMDDAVALCAMDEQREHPGMGQIAPYLPVTPLAYNDYTFGADVHDITIDNIDTEGDTGHQLIFLAGYNKIYNIHASKLKDHGDGTNDKYGIVRFYGNSYFPVFVDGNYHDIFINDIECNISPSAVILEVGAKDSIINKISSTNSAVLVDEKNVIDYNELNFIVQNLLN